MQVRWLSADNTASLLLCRTRGSKGASLVVIPAAAKVFCRGLIWSGRPLIGNTVWLVSYFKICTTIKWNAIAIKYDVNTSFSRASAPASSQQKPQFIYSFNVVIILLNTGIRGPTLKVFTMLFQSAFSHVSSACVLPSVVRRKQLQASRSNCLKGYLHVSTIFSHNVLPFSSTI